MILWQLYFSFFQVGLFTLGGGYAAMPIIQSRVVELHGWLSAQEFGNLVTIAEMTPGPIALNAATFVGMRLAGVPGAVLATVGCISPALVLVTALAFLYKKFGQLSFIQKTLAALRPIIVALIASAGLTVLLGALFGGEIALAALDWAAAVCFGGAFLLIRRFKWNPILTMAAGGAAYTVVNLLISGV